MQIDFHLGVTYVVARLAGLTHEQAGIVATCAQYVDDATNGGLIKFQNRAMYYRFQSAHKMLDYKNFDELANHQVWAPFHFLPGNEGLPLGQGNELDFTRKVICRPNSYIAQDMVKDCIARRDNPCAWHRLGIAMHVYADTWAHQGFSGIQHEVNKVQDLRDEHDQPNISMRERIQAFFGNVIGRVVGDLLPLGHGAALSLPDKPFLKWTYTNGLGEKVVRNNPKDFLEAADHMCQAMQRFIVADPDAAVAGLPSTDKQKIDELLRTVTADSGDERLKIWLSEIKKGTFSFGKADLQYIPKGEGSWKHQALGTTKEIDDANDLFTYDHAFLSSNWKRFHDALQMHRLFVINDLLPRYGICTA